jgi:uncharacterized SAM-binding protein YcdF (DUF218 family)
MNLLELAQTLWDYHKLVKYSSKVDVIIGFGSYDIQTALHSAELFYKNVADKIIFTGNSKDSVKRDWEKSDAEVFAEKALELGVPSKSIIIEPTAGNLKDNIEFSLKLVDTVSSAIIITKPNTLRRAITTAEIKKPNISWFTSCFERDLTEPVTFNHTFEDLINEMVGDLYRIIEDTSKGLEDHKVLPSKVLKAYEDLKKLGYTKNCHH